MHCFHKQATVVKNEWINTELNDKLILSISTAGDTNKNLNIKNFIFENT